MEVRIGHPRHVQVWTDGTLRYRNHLSKHLPLPPPLADHDLAGRPAPLSTPHPIHIPLTLPLSTPSSPTYFSFLEEG